jgi:hypothetical protein
VFQSSIVSFKHLSNFNSLKDFNNHLEAFLSVHKKEFSKGELVCFKTLYRFAAKVYGVSNVSINTLLKAICDRYNGVPISESTFHRMKRKAVKFGILTVISTQRKNGSQSSNLWVFNQFLNTNDTPIESENPSNKESGDNGLTPQETSKEIKTSNKNNTLRTVESVRKNQPEFVASWVNKTFAEFASNWFHPKEVNELWRISFIHGKQLEMCSGDVIEVAIECIKVLVSKIKSRRIDNSMGFYNGVIKRKMKTLWLQNMINNVYALA